MTLSRRVISLLFAAFVLFLPISSPAEKVVVIPMHKQSRAAVRELCSPFQFRDHAISYFKATGGVKDLYGHFLTRLYQQR